MELPPALLSVPMLFKGSLRAVSLAWLAGSLLGCANYSACQDLRENHEGIAEIETALADLETEPPSDERDRRRADLEMRRRMHLASNDRVRSDCRPMGRDRLQELFDPDPHSHERGR